MAVREGPDQHPAARSATSHRSKPQAAPHTASGSRAAAPATQAGRKGGLPTIGMEKGEPCHEKTVRTQSPSEDILCLWFGAFVSWYFTHRYFFLSLRYVPQAPLNPTRQQFNAHGGDAESSHLHQAGKDEFWYLVWHLDGIYITLYCVTLMCSSSNEKWIVHPAASMMRYPVQGRYKQSLPLHI